MPPPAANSYDAIPYRSVAFPQTRPERLAAIAGIFGLDTPPIETARVLELGCASGGNLLSIAHDYPGTRCLGIDGSAVQVADGWKTIEALGLRNIRLKHADILALGDDLGTFDFILCHGVFSWVPPAVQDKILAICRENLAPNGVAYVSYNTYPGWHVRGIVRDMMRYHGTQFQDPGTRLAQAKALVQFVVDTGKVQPTRYKQLLKDEFDILANAEDSYLHHEHLEENNRPLYFHEFARMLAVNGLQYLGEAEFSTMIASNFAPEIAGTLQKIGAHDILQMEQYMDFVRGRYFRQTLICKLGVSLNRQLGPAVVKDEWLLASRAKPEKPEWSYASGEPVEFLAPGGGLTCRSPITKAAMAELAASWPAPIPFAELMPRAKSRAEKEGHAASDASRDFFGSEVLSGVAAGAIEWRLNPVPFETEIGEQPHASALARHQATLGNSVTNLRGETLTLDDTHQLVLRRLDGRTNRTQLIEHLMSDLKSGKHVLKRDGSDEPVTSSDEMRHLLEPALEKVLENMARLALLAPSIHHLLSSERL
jgi:methyltransferase-like protein/SAM-dependent methyltransferase